MIVPIDMEKYREAHGHLPYGFGWWEFTVDVTSARATRRHTREFGYVGDFDTAVKELDAAMTQVFRGKACTVTATVKP